MADKTTQEKVVDYYEKLGSRLGYRLVMHRSKHFGYYDASHVKEKTAQRLFHEKLATLLDLQPGMRLLDAGSGLGVVATYLANNYDVHVTGITLVPHEVKSAQKRAKKRGLSDKTHFQVMDYSKTSFPDACFDRIYTTETLSHAPDVTKVLAEFYRILKPGGKLVAVEYELDYADFTPQETALYDYWTDFMGYANLTREIF